MNYKTIIKNAVPEVQYIVTGIQPKKLKERIPADTSKAECYYCWRTKRAKQHRYYVEQGNLYFSLLESNILIMEISSSLIF